MASPTPAALALTPYHPRATMATRQYSPSGPLDALARWTVDNGGYMHEALTLAASGPDPRLGGTMLTTAPLPRGAPLVACPHALSIDYAKARAHLPAAVLAAMTPHAGLCFFLVQQVLLGEAGRWWPYLRVLPAELNTPLFFDDADMAFLQGCNLGATEVSLRRQIWTAEWRNGVAALQHAGVDTEGYTCERFLWASTIFTSRSFPGKLQHWSGPDSHGVPAAEVDTTEDLPVLFPLVDSLNHRPLTSITWKPGVTEFSLVTNLEIPAGAEVFNNYGPKSNEELLLGYGFTIPNNAMDHVTLRFAPPLSDAQLAIRQQQEQPTRQGNYDLYIDNTPFFPVSLVSLFHILTANTQESRVLAANPKASRISIRNDLATHSQLLMAMKRKLAGFFPDPGEPKTPRQETAKIYRDGQRVILEKAVATAEAAVAELAASERVLTLQRALDSDEEFTTAIEKCFDSRDAEELDTMEAAEIVFVLFLGWKRMTAGDMWKEWYEGLEKVYGPVDPEEATEEMAVVYEQVFDNAPDLAPEVFAREGWSKGLLEWCRTAYVDAGVEVPGLGWAVCVEVVG